MQLIERLVKFGMSQSEAALYLRLAELGRSGAHALAKRCGLPRTTTYSVLDSLVRKGFAFVEKGPGNTIYVANDPSALLLQVSKERAELEHREAEAAELVELVRPSFRSRFHNAPKIQFFEGRDGVEQMLYGNLEIWQTSIYNYDSTWWGYQDHTFVENFRAWLDYTWVRFQAGEKVCLISNSAPIEEQLRGRVRGREIRSINSLLEFSSTIWILGDYIVLIMNRHDPIYSFQIHDPVFAANLRSVFQLLWNFETMHSKVGSKKSTKRK